jgi:hypothetical protein
MQAAVDTLRRSVVYAHACNPLIWEEMAEAYLLVDDDKRAYASCIISSLLYREVGLGDYPSWPALREPWLHERTEILVARARAKVDEWYGEAPTEELKAKLLAPWPETPPPQVKAPPTAKPRAARAGVEAKGAHPMKAE